MPFRQLIQKYTPRSLRNWLRNPQKSFRYVADRLAYACGSTPEAVIAKDWKVRCHPASRHHFAVFNTDPVQAAELKTFAAYCKPGMQLLDVGAHYGFFALAALHFGGKGTRVVCIEASAKAAVILRANLTANGASSDVQVIEAAMGSCDGQLNMLATGPLGSDYFVVPSEHRDDTTLVKQVALTSVLASTGFQPTHVKIDVEGFEEEVIKGGEGFLRAAKPVLFLELHGDLIRRRNQKPESVVGLLRSFGYERFISDGRELSDADMQAMHHNCRLTCLSSKS